jgi:L-aspartate oxidase
MIEEGANSINTLINWGVNFDSDNNGKLLLTKEGGHSLRRIIHYKDTTGQEIIRGMFDAAITKENITLLDNAFVMDLIVEHNHAHGIRVIKNNEV